MGCGASSPSAVRGASQAALAPSPAGDSALGTSARAEPAAATSPAERRGPGPGQWKRGELLGKGAHGSVYMGLDERTGGLIAVKEISFTPRDKQMVLQLQAEVELLATCQHPNIICYLGSAVERGSATEEESQLHIFSEWVAGGSIHTIIQRFGRLAEPVAARYTAQILEGLQYLHKKKVIHRDIKGDNILIMADGSVKIADFGVAKRIGLIKDTLNGGSLTAQSIGSLKLQEVTGTPYYMAPEVMEEDGYGRKASPAFPLSR